jgi:hypothetical protein
MSGFFKLVMFIPFDYTAPPPPPHPNIAIILAALYWSYHGHKEWVLSNRYRI